MTNELLTLVEKRQETRWDSQQRKEVETDWHISVYKIHQNHIAGGFNISLNEHKDGRKFWKAPRGYRGFVKTAEEAIQEIVDTY